MPIFFIYSSGKLARLKSLYLVVSHTFLNKKMDEFGAEHDKQLRDQEFSPNLVKKVVVE